MASTFLTSACGAVASPRPRFACISTTSKNRGYTCAYTQTWSGNHAMLRVAEKLGFTEYFRKKNHRTVNGEQYDAVTLKIEL